MTPWKECNFFTGGPRPRLGYRAFFLPRAECRERGITVVGESTPYYLFHPAVPRRAAACLPGVKAIAILRNPVDRAWSHYRHNARLGIEPLSFEAALEAEPLRIGGEMERVTHARFARSNTLRHFSYIARGRYAEQLRRWFGALGRDRVHVVLLEDLLGRTRETMSAIARFLDVADVFEGDLPERNRGDDLGDCPPDLRRRLEREFEASNRDLAGLLDIEIDW
jgi:hypothetical protein